MAEHITRVDDEGNTLKTVRYRGHSFVDGFPKNPESRLDAMQDFKCRADDIIVAAYPKSGIHWTYNLLKMLATKDTSYKGSPVCLEYEDFQEFENMDSPRVYTIHSMFELIPKEMRENKARIIHLSRNPKDVLVSYYHFLTSVTAPWYRGNFNGLFRFFFDKDFILDSWFGFEKNWYHAQKKNPENKILQLRYEDMRTDLYGKIKELSDFLDLNHSEDFLKEVEKKVSFENLKKEHEEKSLNVGPDYTEFMDKSAGVFPIYRKGIIGDWKNYLTVAQNEYFDKMYAELMEGCDLEFKYE